MKKFIAILMVLAMCMVPVFASAGANVAHIETATYEDGFLIGEVDFQGGPFWARCTFFLTGGRYLLVSIPIYADGTFEMYFDGPVEAIAIQIKDTRNLIPGGTVYDTLML